MMAKCRSCGAEIRWIVTASGRRMPLDAEPHPEGNIDADGEGTGYVVKGPQAGDTLIHGRPLYRSHFATCPFAAQHRKQGQGDLPGLDAGSP